MTKVESDIVPVTYKESLQNKEIIWKKQRVPLGPSQLNPSKQTKEIPWVINKVSLQSRANKVKTAMNQRSVLWMNKYGPGLEPHWKDKSARLPALTKYLM